MKKNTLFLLALVAMTVGAMQTAHAGSAVAIQNNHANLATAYGGPVEREKARALDNARRLYGNDVRILASSDVTGYGAIAVARHPNGRGSIIGVALGMRTATEADTVAIKKCLKAGGINPQVKWPLGARTVGARALYKLHHPRDNCSADKRSLVTSYLL